MKSFVERRESFDIYPTPRSEMELERRIYENMESAFDFENVIGIGEMVSQMAAVINDRQLSALVDRASDENGVNAVLSRTEEIWDDPSSPELKRASAQMLLISVRNSRRLNQRAQTNNPFIKGG